MMFLRRLLCTLLLIAAITQSASATAVYKPDGLLTPKIWAFNKDNSFEIVSQALSNVNNSQDIFLIMPKQSIKAAILQKSWGFTYHGEKLLAVRTSVRIGINRTFNDKSICMTSLGDNIMIEDVSGNVILVWRCSQSEERPLNEPQAPAANQQNIQSLIALQDNRYHVSFYDKNGKFQSAVYEHNAPLLPSEISLVRLLSSHHANNIIEYKALGPDSVQLQTWKARFDTAPKKNGEQRIELTTTDENAVITANNSQIIHIAYNENLIFDTVSQPDYESYLKTDTTAINPQQTLINDKGFLLYDTPRSLRIAFQLKGDASKCFSETPRQKAAFFPDNPGKVVIDINGETRPDLTTKAPMTKELQAELSLALTETNGIQCRNKEIINCARHIVGSEKEPFWQALLINTWVNKYIQYSSDVGDATALDTLHSKRGDCSEYSTLFVALARAIGIPARPLSGWLVAGDSVIGQHAWVEVWTGNRWVELDPTNGGLANARNIRRKESFYVSDSEAKLLDMVPVSTTVPLLHTDLTIIYGVPAISIALQCKKPYTEPNTIVNRSRCVFGSDGKTFTMTLNGESRFDTQYNPPKNYDSTLIPYLKPTNGIESDNREVRKKAIELTKGTPDSCWKVVRLLQYTHSLNVNEVVCDWSAADTLRSGDASRVVTPLLAHAYGNDLSVTRLFVAMARSINIPSRIVTGWYIEGGSASQRSWAEVWLGRWFECSPKNGGWITSNYLRSEIIDEKSLGSMVVTQMEYENASGYTTQSIRCPYCFEPSSYTSLVTTKEPSNWTDDAFQSIVPISKKSYLIMTRKRPAANTNSGLKQPYPDTQEIKESLASTSEFPCSDPEIIKLTREIVNKEKRTWEQLRMIGKWICANMNCTNPPGAWSTAERLRLRDSSSVSASRVFITMARVLGIPARLKHCVHLDGVLYSVSDVYYVYLDGWTPLNTLYDLEILTPECILTDMPLSINDIEAIAVKKIDFNKMDISLTQNSLVLRRKATDNAAGIACKIAFPSKPLKQSIEYGFCDVIKEMDFPPLPSYDSGKPLPWMVFVLLSNKNEEEIIEITCTTDNPAAAIDKLKTGSAWYDRTYIGSKTMDRNGLRILQVNNRVSDAKETGQPVSDYIVCHPSGLYITLEVRDIHDNPLPNKDESVIPDNIAYIIDHMDMK